MKRPQRFRLKEFADFLRQYPHITDTKLGQEWIADYTFSNHWAIRVDDSGCTTQLDTRDLTARYIKATNEVLEGK